MDDGPGAICSSRDQLHFLRKALIHWSGWDQAAAVLAHRLRTRQAEHGLLDPAPADPSQTAAALTREAHVKLGRLLESAQCDEITAFFRASSGFAGHHMSSSDGREREFDAVVAEGSRYFSYRPETVMAAPHLMALANRPEIVDVVTQALGCLPVLYSVNAWWSFPVPGEPWPPHSQQFHRDDDDFRFFTLFVYLTDVEDERDGPNQIIPLSQTAAGMQGVMNACRVLNEDLRRELMKTFPEPPGLGQRFLGAAVQSTFGPRGTAFLADTRALHRGLAPSGRARLIFWARYGLGPNTNSSDDHLQAGPVRAAELGSALPDSPRNH